jgi:pullulanase/glycogen debranching enzyme
MALINKTTSRITEGMPSPIGATWDGLGINFALFSAHAIKEITGIGGGGTSLAA